MDLADAYRFEFVVATVHWAHTELAVDLHVERDGPAALLTAVVPTSATTGTCRSSPNGPRCVAAVW